MERGQTPRPRKGAPANGRRFSVNGADREAVAKCSGCRHWQPFVDHWGRCGGAMVRHHVDGEGPLVTRGSFSCKFFSLRASADASKRSAGRQSGERAPAEDPTIRL